MQFSIFNTLSAKKELFETGIEPVKLFICGPTVYDYSHIGHARTYVAFDIIARYLRSRGVKLTYLQNITDIDDKIIDRAQREGDEAIPLAKRFTKAYRDDMKTLGITSVDTYAPASKYVKEIIKQITQLIEKDYAYQTPNGVYFEVKKFPDYSKLSKQDLDALRPGYRIEPDPHKKDPLDFALWKIKKHAFEPSWKSPWGEGRPGWHIEDTAITEKHFGQQYDIHGGAVDLKFPHHESEIAQQEAASGKKPFVKIWMHTGFLLINGEKMSKSLGNFTTIRDFLEKHPANVLRYMVASHHYRSPIDYTEQLVKSTENTLKNLTNTFAKLAFAQKRSKSQITNHKSQIEEYERKFIEAMDDDFNTPAALAILFEAINDVNGIVWNLSKADVRTFDTWLRGKFSLFGLSFILAKVPPKIATLTKEREKLRKKKEFAKADAVRTKIEKAGYRVDDTPVGPFILPN